MTKYYISDALDQLTHQVKRVADYLEAKQKQEDDLKVKEVQAYLDRNPVLDVAEELKERGYISAIKKCRELTGKDLRSAKEYVDKLRVRGLQGFFNDL